MGLPPPPAFSRGQKGLPSLSRVLACVLQDGSHGACLCFRHFPGTASGCKAALRCHETLFVFVPLPFPLCLWPSGSFTASGFYRGPLWSAFWTPLSAFFLCPLLVVFQPGPGAASPGAGHPSVSPSCT